MEDMDLSRQFGGAYAGRRVLVTGHTGFKGSWLALWLRTLGARVHGAALPPDTDPSHWTELGLNDVADHVVDVGDAQAVATVMASARPEIVFHLAAQPLVSRGYREPHWTFATNVIGTVNVLEAVRSAPSVRAAIIVTTDKVYAEDGRGRPFQESDALGGGDPYAASKACAELVVQVYRRSFFSSETSPRVASVRAGNVIGGGDWSENRLVPDCYRAVTTGAALRLRYPDSVRPWQHVLDALSGYLHLGRALLGRTSPLSSEFNFGPSATDTMSVRQLVGSLQAFWPALSVDIQPMAAEFVETPVLRLDSGRAESELGWRPVWNTEQALERTARWYARFLRDRFVSSYEDLHAYARDARAAGAVWAGSAESFEPAGQVGT